MTFLILAFKPICDNLDKDGICRQSKTCEYFSLKVFAKKVRQKRMQIECCISVSSKQSLRRTFYSLV